MLYKILVLLTIVSTSVLADNFAGLARGISNLDRFHHHVLINSKQGDQEVKCSGSIIKSQWILTSKKCVCDDNEGNVKELKISFDEFMSNHSFSITLQNPIIFKYPTLFDDIALVALPVQLLITTNSLLTSVVYSTTPEYTVDTLGVIPGIDSSMKNALTYGIYQIANGTYCESKDEYDFDIDSQLCVLTKRYVQNTVDCSQASGTGLLVGWPTKPVLVGIYSAPNKCEPNKEFRGYFTNVGQYSMWIDSIVSA